MKKNDNFTKRIKTRFFAILCLFLSTCLIFSACKNENGRERYASIYSGGKFSGQFEVFQGFSVNYIDVGEGDAIFINFGDGKTMLIDCGEESERNYNSVKNYLDAYTDGVLDYFMLTHVDSDHVGNAVNILNRYTVNTVFIPYVLNVGNFSAYSSAYQTIQAKNVSKIYSSTGKKIVGDNYYLIILSPNEKQTEDSAYDDFNGKEIPSADERNNLSPIVYLNYNGVRFVFTGDAGKSQETVALNNVDMGLADRFLKNDGKEAINLDGIDFLKVSHHGANDASGETFVNRLAPKNAVISVAGDNVYGFPTEVVLSRIRAANANCKIYATSVYGNVSVTVGENGNVKVVTSADLN